MPDDPWAALAGPFVDDAYATVKGQVRTYVLHHQLLRHLAEPPATVLDVGGGGANQSLPLARLGYRVTLLDPSPAMLGKARERLSREPEDVRSRVTLVEAPGESAAEVTDGAIFAAVLCHGVLLYLESPAPTVDVLCRCVAPRGLLSIMTLNARTLAVRPALEGRWEHARAALDATTELGPLGLATRGDTVDGLSDLIRAGGVEPESWYGTWLFADWIDLDVDGTDVREVAELELEASQRDPYRQLSRAFHLIGRRRPA